MRKKLMAMGMAVATAACVFAMTTRLTYVKVSDAGCNNCLISNEDEGVTRKCGQCDGFLEGGKSKTVADGWQQAVFTCKKCGHPSTWKYKMQ